MIRALRLGFSWFGLAFVAAIVPRDCPEGVFIYSTLRAMANTANEKQAEWLAGLRSKL